MTLSKKPVYTYREQEKAGTGAPQKSRTTSHTGDKKQPHFMRYFLSRKQFSMFTIPVSLGIVYCSLEQKRKDGIVVVSENLRYRRNQNKEIKRISNQERQGFPPIKNQGGAQPRGQAEQRNIRNQQAAYPRFEDQPKDRDIEVVLWFGRHQGIWREVEDFLRFAARGHLSVRPSDISEILAQNDAAPPFSAADILWAWRRGALREQGRGDRERRRSIGSGHHGQGKEA